MLPSRAPGGKPLFGFPLFHAAYVLGGGVRHFHGPPGSLASQRGGRFDLALPQQLRLGLAHLPGASGVAHLSGYLSLRITAPFLPSTKALSWLRLARLLVNSTCNFFIRPATV